VNDKVVQFSKRALLTPDLQPALLAIVTSKRCFKDVDYIGLKVVILVVFDGFSKGIRNTVNLYAIKHSLSDQVDRVCSTTKALLARL
jgi:hypothetical protein